MMRLLLNGLGASAGSGLTYLYNAVPLLSSRKDAHTILVVQPQLRRDFAGYRRVELPHVNVPPSTMRRFWFEQRALPQLVRRLQADVVLSVGNFAVRNCPAPQILLSGNSLYTSADFREDLRRRWQYGMLMENAIKAALARQSVRWAQITVAPSRAFAQQLSDWSGRPVRSIHHGFDRELFFQSATVLPTAIQSLLDANSDCLKLLFVSHYNYYRNFETLFRALPIVRERLKNRGVRLLLTCKLRRGENPGTYNPVAAAKLIRELNIGEEVVELGSVPYQAVHHLYRACDVYVTPAYTETFAHPLVEAMASGLPIVASDLAVHREIAGNAALYFSRFSAAELAEKIIQLVTTAGLAQSLEEFGRRRAEEFNWDNHVSELLDLAASMRVSQKSQVRVSAA